MGLNEKLDARRREVDAETEEAKRVEKIAIKAEVARRLEEMGIVFSNDPNKAAPDRMVTSEKMKFGKMLNQFVKGITGTGSCARSLAKLKNEKNKSTDKTNQETE